MRKDAPTYTCDKPGCRSQCTLSPGETDLLRALVSRGWAVEEHEGGGSDKHYCPVHVPVIKVVAPEGP